MKLLKNITLLFITSQIGFGAITIDITEEPGGVLIKTSGAVDVTGLTLLGPSNIDVGPILSSGTFGAIANGIDGPVMVFPSYSGANLNLNSFFLPTSGDIFRPELVDLPNIAVVDETLFSFELLIPEAYSDPSAPPAPVEITLAGETFASLDIIDGVTNSATWETGTGTESISFRTGSAVPELSSPFLAIAGILSFVRLRRR